MSASVTCIAPVNIAVIKYWGKRDEELILPINDSISGTLSTEHMYAKTTICASPDFKQNQFWLNSKEESFDNPRLKNCLSEVKKHASANLGELLRWKIHICSENNFPTAAGLASSAAGYACLVFCLSQLYELKTNISTLARIGSGSACRSICGGFVHWHKGSQNNGQDSIATQIVPANHWPQMRVVVLVVNDNKKKYSSTTGMKTTVETSELIKFRSDLIVPKRISEMTEAIINRDFETFATITMKDSNQFHAVCLDTYPPCVYMNDVSHAIADLVHQYNTVKGGIKVAYTFDAGPNACLYLLESDVNEVVNCVNEAFPPQTTNRNEYIKGFPIKCEPLSRNIKEKLNIHPHPPGCLKYIIHTKIGEGPKVLHDASEHLLTEEGLPKEKVMLI